MIRITRDPLDAAALLQDFSRDRLDTGAVVSFTGLTRSRTGDRTDNDWAGHIADYHRHSMEHGIGEYLEKQIGLEK